MAKPLKPEPKFFLVDDLYRRGLAYYSERWFADAPPDRAAGEKSTDYLESRSAAERIARGLPTVKLVFILRNPVERAFSNYAWTRMNGIETEDFATALRLEPERERTLPERWKFARPFSYFSRGLYADLLAEYLERFPREQLLVLRFEDIERDAAAVTERVHRFIGVPPRPADAGGLGIVNPSDKRGDTMTADVRRELQARYAEPNRRLAEMLGPDFAAW